MKSVTGGILISASCLCPAALNMNAREKAFDVGMKLGLDRSSDNSSKDLLELLQGVSARKLLRTAGVSMDVISEGIQIIFRYTQTDRLMLRIIKHQK
nr:unnamed protein product [Callosobruchus chinensis]